MSEENVEMVRRWWAGFNEHGMPPLDLCDERIEIEMPAEFPFHGPYRGHAGVRKWASEVFDVAEEPRTEVGEVIETGDGETVYMELRTLGRFRHSQIEVDTPRAPCGESETGSFWRRRATCTGTKPSKTPGSRSRRCLRGT